MYYIYGISWPSTYSLSTLWYFWWPLPIFSFSVSDFCFSFSFQLSVYIFRFLHFHLPYISKLPPEAVEKDLFNVHPMKKMNKQPPTCGWSVWYYSIPIVPHEWSLEYVNLETSQATKEIIVCGRLGLRSYMKHKFQKKIIQERTGHRSL